jgi:uncharacterized membrane protein (DUF485 family)
LDASHRALLDSEDFRRLVRRRWLVSLVLTALLFVLYYGYIILIAVDRTFLSQRIGDGTMTVGIPIGAAVIVGSWLLTAVYIGWANRVYDSEVTRLRQRVASTSPGTDR